MRVVAEYVMRGRYQAIGVSLLSASLPPPISWLSSAVVSLVILRKGVGEGALALLAGCLPLLVLFFYQADINPLVALFGTACLAGVLRTTVSWEVTLAAAVVISIAGSLIFEVTSADLTVRLASEYLNILENIKASAEPSAGLVLPSPADAQNIVLGLFSVGFALSMMVFLGLARWWQSLLYNPGGFGREFKALRLSPQISGLLVLGLVGALGFGGFFRWANLFALPLLLAAAGFVHWFVAERNLSRSWLVSFYLLVVFMYQLVSPLLATLALLDSWFDLRKRLRLDPVKPTE